LKPPAAGNDPSPPGEPVTEVPAATDPSAPGRRRTSIALVVAAQSTQGMLLGGLGLFLPLIRDDLHLSFARAGTIGAASTLVYAFMQLPSGYAADRVSPRTLFLVGMTGTNLLGLAFAAIHDYHLALANQAVSGLMRAMVFAPGMLLIAGLFPAGRRATAMGLYIAGGFSSNVLLNLAGPWLVGPVGWRGLFAAFSLLGLLLTLGLWRFGRFPEQARGDGPPPLREGLRLLREPVMWLLNLVQYARLAVVHGLNLWLPTLIVADKGHSLAFAGAMVAVSAAVTAPANLIGGHLADRTRRPLGVVAVSLGALAVTTTLLAHADRAWQLVIVVAVNAVFVQLYFGPLFSIPVELYGTRTAGFATGFGNLWANLGGFTFTLLLGVIKDATGSFTAGLYAMAALCVAALAATGLVRRLTRDGPVTEAPVSRRPGRP
jgi:MFS transporter, ACS family, D-galactonate transporter